MYSGLFPICFQSIQINCDRPLPHPHLCSQNSLSRRGDTLCTLVYLVSYTFLMDQKPHLHHKTFFLSQPPFPQPRARHSDDTWTLVNVQTVVGLRWTFLARPEIELPEALLSTPSPKISATTDLFLWKHLEQVPFWATTCSSTEFFWFILLFGFGGCWGLEAFGGEGKASHSPG